MYNVLICDFMSDSYLEECANYFVSKSPNIFNHLISHKKPHPNSPLGKLNFCDANKFYQILNNDFFIKENKYKELPSEIEYDYEPIYYFTAAYDRCLPLTVSFHDKIKHYWSLYSYFFSYLTKNRITHVVFDNVPHMPWDIVLFYICKKFEISTLIFRRTGISGYIYLDEDFRVSKCNWKFNYKNFANDHIVNDEKNIDLLINKSFTKDQKGGKWIYSQKKTDIFQFILKILRIYGFSNVIILMRHIVKKPLKTFKYATLDSCQSSLFSGLEKVNRLQNVLLCVRFLLKNKNIKYEYKKNTSFIDLKKTTYIYFPLHYQPERTTLPEGNIFDEQFIAIKLLSQSIAKNFKIIVKEHPRQFEYDLRSLHSRSICDYSRINSLENVFIVSEKFCHNELIQYSSFTSTISGSVTWEGLLQGKPGIIFSENWLQDCNFVHRYKNKKEFHNFINKKISRKDVHDEVKYFCKRNCRYFINSALNINHLNMFFKDNKIKAIKNLSDALIQRIN